MSVIILRFLHPHVAHTSYLVADPDTGTAAVIDPYRDVERYLEAAQRLGATIRHILLTEQHDDFSGGHHELRQRTSATIYAGAWTRSLYEFLPVKDGDVLEFGHVRLTVLETPGHRFEGITVLIHDLLTSSREPLGAFTGDTILLGDVGLPEPRPEDGLSPSDMAGLLYDSIRRKILPLPDTTRLYPASVLAAPGERDTTVGAESLMRFQRIHNPALQAATRRDFTRRLVTGLNPELFTPGKARSVRLRPASLSEILRARRSGAQLVDVRSPADFAAAHLEGSLNLALGAAFEEWAPSLLDRNRPLLLVAPPHRENEAGARFAAAGFEQVAGFLKGGIQALEERADLLRRDRRLSLPAFEEALGGCVPPQVVDASRSGTPGFGLWIPLENLSKWLGDLGADRATLVCAETSPRASAAASFLRLRGFSDVRSLAGGLTVWGRTAPA